MNVMEPAPSRKNADELRDLKQLPNRHMLVSSPHMTALIYLRATLMKAIRTFMASEGFVEVTTPIITGLTCL
jgi:aspartyl/asparaginyl-tRNA synthetase